MKEREMTDRPFITGTVIGVFNIPQMLYNIIGPEISELAGFDSSPQRVAELTEITQEKTGYHFHLIMAYLTLINDNSKGTIQ